MRGGITARFTSDAVADLKSTDFFWCDELRFSGTAVHSSNKRLNSTSSLSRRASCLARERVYSIN
jgi:hypothetical protein